MNTQAGTRDVEVSSLSREALPIVHVTVLEDRARVRRRGRVRLTAGVHALSIEVAKVAVDRTLSGTVLDGAQRSAIGSLHIERVRLHEPSALPAAIAALDEALHAARRTVASIDARLRELEARFASLATVGQLAVQDTVLDASYDVGSSAIWRERDRAIDEAAFATQRERVELERKRADAQLEVGRLERERASASATVSRERATVRFTVEASRDGELELELEYVVANACWRPIHRAVLEGDQLTMHTDACVWQRTGEPWERVTLEVSTERSAHVAEPPKLTTDWLAVQRKTTQTQVAVRSQTVAHTGQGLGPKGAQSATKSDAQSDALPGVDDGGTPLTVRIPRLVDVREDGRAHRFPMQSFTTRAEASLRAIPEVLGAVLRRSLQTNEASTPLLAGPVELVRGGGLVGRTSLRFVAPGERFELGWGPDGALRLDTDERTRPGEVGLLSTARATLVERTTRVSNLSAEPKTFELVERVPVSELEKVKITVDARRTTGGATPDADGMVRFPVRLEPRGRATIELVFEVRAASDVTGLPY